MIDNTNTQRHSSPYVVLLLKHVQLGACGEGADEHLNSQRCRGVYRWVQRHVDGVRGCSGVDDQGFASEHAGIQ